MKISISSFSCYSNYIRIAPNKIYSLLLKIKKKSYFEALIILKHFSQKASLIIWKALYSAVINSGFPKNLIIITESFVNQGLILKRIQPRAKGKSFPIQKKMSHLTISIGLNH